MKKYIYILAVICFFPLTVQAVGIFDETQEFFVARATKLGRSDQNGFGAISRVAGPAEIEQFVDCDINCTSCNNKTGTCSRCAPGRYLKDNLCIACPSNASCGGGSEYSCNSYYRKVSSECISICFGVSCKSGTSPVSKTASCCCEG